jgi:hypothetical protein
MCTDYDINTASASQVRRPSQLTHQLLEEGRDIESDKRGPKPMLAAASGISSSQEIQRANSRRQAQTWSEPSPAYLEQAGDISHLGATAAPRRSVSSATKAQGETKTYSFEKWRVLQKKIAEGNFSGTIAFAKLKLISRMIEKTQRCYKGDPSQLTDLCRAAVGFDSLEDLANCLGRNSEKSVYSDFAAQL